MMINNGVIYLVDTLADYKIQTIVDSITADNKLGLGKDSIKFEAKPTITNYDFAGRNDRSIFSRYNSYLIHPAISSSENS